MQKYSFLDDYSEGCHPNILDKLIKTNKIQQNAYGFDDYCKKAKKSIKSKVSKKSQVFFVTGGTQANLIICSQLLKPYEAIVSASTGHILDKEAGAIENTGHKIISVKSNNGKLTCKQIAQAVKRYSFAPHMVKIKLVYISNATEVGTIYTKKELKKIYTYCQENDLYLFLDGARLATSLCSKYADTTLKDISKLTDIFTLGATKNGALLGESIIINRPKIALDFNINIKQKGALLAKGRVLGIQLLELFKNNLYFDLANKANEFAYSISDAFVNKGYKLFKKTQSNQIFLILPNSLIEKLQMKFTFSIWEEYDKENSIVRLVTSWATNEEKVEELINCI